MSVNRKLYRVIFCISGMLLFAVLAICSDVNDQLLLIREGFKDGLYDLVKMEALDFLESEKNHPQSAEVELILGIIETNSNNLNAAIQHLQRATQAGDIKIRSTASYKLAKSYFSRKNHSDAAKWFSATAQSTNETLLKTNAQFWYGISSYLTEQPEQTIDIFNKSDFSTLSAAQLIKLHYYRGCSYLETSQLQLGFKDLDIVYNAKNVLAYSAALIAMEYSMKNNLFPTADLWADRALRIKNSQELILFRANIAYQAKRWCQAFTCYQSALSKNTHDEAEFEDIVFHSTICAARCAKYFNEQWWNPLLHYLNTFPDSPHNGEILMEIVSESNYPVPHNVVDYLIRGFFNSDPRLGNLISDLYLRVNDYDRALFWITKYLVVTEELKPSLSLRLTIAKMMKQLGESKDALDEIISISKFENSGSDSKIVQANLSFQEGKYENASVIYQQWIINQPESEKVPEILFWLGESYFRLEKWNLAVRALNESSKSIEFSDKYNEISIRHQIICHFKLFHWKDVADISTMYLKTFNQSEYIADILLYQGLAYGNLEDYDLALQALGGSLDRIKNPEYVELIKESIRRIDGIKYSSKMSHEDSDGEILD